MKTTNFKGTYVAPAIEVESIYVEKGFAASGDMPDVEDVNPWL